MDPPHRAHTAKAFPNCGQESHTLVQVLALIFKITVLTPTSCSFNFCIFRQDFCNTFLLLRGAAQSIAAREDIRPRSALRLQTPPLQRRTHRTPGCAPLKRRRHSPARSTCADALSLRSSPLGADMVGKSRNMSADMLFMPGLLALMPPTICCVRSQSVRDFVTEISGGATPAPVRCGSEL